MPHYRARDAWRVPSLLSLARLPLAVLFVLAVDEPALAFAILVLAGATDVLDGWYARRFDQVTATGAVIDPIADKTFVLTVVVTLVIHGHFPLFAIPLLGAREIGELPLVLWLALSRNARRARTEEPSANLTGKVATLLQFATIGIALFRLRPVNLMLGLTAVIGAAAAISYWRTFLRFRDTGPTS
jgi:cardiolipin synthase